ncbi:deoxycytidylate deaminase isoform X1 [Marmota flaviventris]|uniref:deoxycytidylate deaminase isoform X1 n=1 Tax=Marmota flaviventris TaxID=93162 RepID=UPI003A87E8A1
MSEVSCKKRDDYLEWPEYFMAVAFLSAQRSKDPNSQVGACIVNTENKIVGIGYNGMPNGCSDDLLPWRRTADNKLDTKYPYDFPVMPETVYFHTWLRPPQKWHSSSKCEYLLIFPERALGQLFACSISEVLQNTRRPWVVAVPKSRPHPRLSHSLGMEHTDMNVLEAPPGTSLPVTAVSSV